MLVKNMAAASERRHAFGGGFGWMVVGLAWPNLEHQAGFRKRHVPRSLSLPRGVFDTVQEGQEMDFDIENDVRGRGQRATNVVLGDSAYNNPSR